MSDRQPEINALLHETRVFPPSEAMVKQANISGMAAYEAMRQEAERDFEGFWAKHARNELIWTKPFTQVVDESKAPFFRWFHDGELNASANCLDRHLRTQPDKIAIIFEADDGKVTKCTYKDLYHRVCQFANGLKSLGIQKGERVLIYMPMSIEAVVAMQACARSGFAVDDVFPDVADLPENLTTEQFRAIYGGVGSQRYRQVVGDIEARLDRCPVLSVRQRCNDGGP